MTISNSYKHSQAWWKEANVYQIYPASFKDSNNDGLGDLDGIISKLDYIKNLNIDVVWLCPINKSPLKDMGYDISDYKDIDPRYGTLETVDRLIQGLKERGMKLIMDLVVNHTSDQHEWFKQSRSSKINNPKRDWYIWKPAKYDADGNRHPPNNWSSFFTPSAWTWDDETQEYYLHLFAKEQPDLNWENPQVRTAVHDIVTFWLDRGVAGFRLDVINCISKVQTFPDAPVTIPGNEYQPGYQYFANGPRLHEYLHELGLIFDKYDAFSVGEGPFIKDTSEFLKTVGADRHELRMIFQFDMVELDNGPDGSRFTKGKFNIIDMKTKINRWQKLIPSGGGWNAIFIENHDQSRAISRYLSDEPQFRAFAAKLIAVLLISQQGTTYVYQGQELALANVPRDWPIEEYIDIESLHFWNELKAKNATKQDLKEALDLMNLKGRENARTPMHWDATAYGGFTSSSSAKPWMRVTEDYKDWNAANQVNDPESVYSFWSKALKLRKDYKSTFVYAPFELLSESDPSVVAFLREAEDGKDTSYFVMNFTKDPVTFYSEIELIGFDVLLNNYSSELIITDNTVSLQPYQAVIFHK